MEVHFLMAKFSPQEKVQAVRRYLEGNEGHKKIAKSIGVSRGVFHNWIKLYQHSGESAFEKRYTSYSAEFKLDILNYRNEHGTSVGETAAIFNMPSASMILKWQNAFDLGGFDALQPKKKGRPSMKKDQKKKNQLVEGSQEALLAELEYLRMENAYLKKLNALVQEERKSQNVKKQK